MSNSNPSTHPTPCAPFKMRVAPFKISPRLSDGQLSAFSSDAL